MTEETSAVLDPKPLPLQANDPPLVAQAYTVWNRMIENGSLDVKRACEETGVPRWQFYKALKSEVVQAEIAKWLDVMQTVEAKLLRDNWYHVISHQIDIATGRVGDARVSVRAAHFLASIREGVEDDYKGKALPEEGESAAARMLRMFSPAEPRRFSAKRTTVTEEVTVKGDEP